MQLNERLQEQILRGLNVLGGGEKGYLFTQG